MRLLKQNFSHLSVVAAAFLLPACGGDSPAEAVPDPVVAATPALTTAPTPTPTPAPTPPTPTPTPTACISAPTPTTGYSLVFKGCSATNVAEYYDKTECVRDNATGLIWQGQNAAGAGIRANDQYKTNYDSTTALQKYDATVLGNYRAPTAAEINSPTNSIGFKNNVNSTNLCGSGAWRLPTLDELSGIVKAGDDPSIDIVWFPNTVDWFYWTSTPFAGYADVAWNVNFYLGNDDIGARGGPSANLNLVRLVHQ